MRSLLSVSCSSNLWCVDVLNNFNKMPITSYRWVLKRPLNAIWLILAISASSLSSPEIAISKPTATEKMLPPSALVVQDLKSENLNNKTIPSNNVVVETIASQQEIAQVTPTTPSTTPNQSTTDTDTPVNPPVPIIPAPGTEGVPRQETPNQLEFDITPGDGTPTIENNVPAPNPQAPGNQAPASTPAPNPQAPGNQAPPPR